jgi:hypothetical protein
MAAAGIQDITEFLQAALLAPAGASVPEPRLADAAAGGRGSMP